MLCPHDEDTLKNRSYATLILRLTLDARGRLIKGELVDVPATREQRFTGVEGLTRTVNTWLKQQEREGGHS